MPRHQKTAEPKRRKFPLVRSWIQKLRHDLGGWSLAEIAREADVDYGLLRKWSSGINKPEWENTLALCNLHHTVTRARPVSVKMLTDGQGTGVQSSAMTARDEFEALLLERFRAMTPVERLKLLGSLEPSASQPPAAPLKR